MGQQCYSETGKSPWHSWYLFVEIGCLKNLLVVCIVCINSLGIDIIDTEPKVKKKQTNSLFT